MKGLVFIVLAVGAVALFAIGGNRVNEPLWNKLKADVPACRQMIDLLTARGIIHSIERSDVTRVEVNDAAWHAAENRWKVASAIYPYCINSPDSGRHSVMVYGRHSGKLLASVTNGDYSAQ